MQHQPQNLLLFHFGQHSRDLEHTALRFKIVPRIGLTLQNFLLRRRIGRSMKLLFPAIRLEHGSWMIVWESVYILTLALEAIL